MIAKIFIGLIIGGLLGYKEIMKLIGGKKND